MIRAYALNLLLSLPVLAHEPPEIQYSDLDSAPERAWVTVWGEGFGGEPGQVLAGEVATDRDDIVSWRSTRIEFRLPPGATDGLRVKTRAGQLSGLLPFDVRRNGQIYFVAAADGNDRNDGRAAVAGADHGPWRTLSRVLESVRPGDVVYVREGQYAEVGDVKWRSHLLVRDRYSGRPGMPIALVAYPGEEPVIGARGALGVDRGVHFHQGISDWTLAKFEIRANSTAIGFTQVGQAARVRIVGNRASGIPSRYGTLVLSACSDCKVLGNHIHDSGQPGNKLSHLIYYGGYGPAENVEIAWNLLHDQRGGRCIQVYGHTNEDSLRQLSIHDNVLYNCPYDCILVGGSDARADDWIRDAAIYNNVAWSCGQAGIRLDNAGVDALILRNTIYDTRHALRLDDASDVVVRNNIFAQPGDADPVLALRRFRSLNMSNNGYTGRGPVPREESDPFRGRVDFLDPKTSHPAPRRGSAFFDRGIGHGAPADGRDTEVE